MESKILKLKGKDHIAIYLLTIIYICVSFFPNTNISFAIIGFTLFLMLIFTPNLSFHPIYLNYFFFYTILILISFSKWQPNYDSKDIISSYLFFSVIPILFQSLSVKYFTIIEQSIKHFWILLAISICVWGGIEGIDFNRSRIFNIDNLNKNGVATFFEIGFIIYYFSNKDQSTIKKTITISLCLLSTLFIGSKTSIALIIFILFLPQKLIKKTFFLIPVILFFLFLIIISNIATIYNFLVDKDEFFTASLRFILWEKAIEDVIINYNTFFFGIGPGSFETAGLNIGDLSTIESPHNYMLAMFNAYGLIGLILFIWYFSRLLFLQKTNNSYNDYYFLSYTLFFLHSLFDVGWVKGQGFFIAMISGIMIKTRKSNP